MDAEELISGKELIRRLGLGDGGLAWLREEGCPCRQEGRTVRWSEDDVRAWLVSRAQALGRAESSGEPIKRAELSRKRALAERYELELEVLRERYMLRADARELFGRVSGLLKRQVPVLSRQLDGARSSEIERALLDQLEQIAKLLEGVEV